MDESKKEFSDKEYEKYLSETEWGKQLIAENEFDTAIKLLKKSHCKVKIIKTYNENVICPGGESGFCLEGFKTEKECKDFCKKIGWKII